MLDTETLPVEALVVDPLQARAEPWCGDTADRRLAASIAREGLLQDILVRPLSTVAPSHLDLPATSDVTHTIIAGSRRYYAAMDAGYETVRCKVLAADDLDAAWASLTENTDRQALSEQAVAQQLAAIFEFVRPRDPPEACPQCDQPVAGANALYSHYGQSDCSPPPVTPPSADPPDAPDGDAGVAPSMGGDAAADAQETAATDSVSMPAAAGPAQPRFHTDRQAYRYLAAGLLGRTDADAVDIVRGHLRTATLPPAVQALFKPARDRTEAEAQALANHGIDTETTLGSGDGHSGTAAALVSLHETVETDQAADGFDATAAVLETVSTLEPQAASEQELRRSLRDVRRELSADTETEATAIDRTRLRETLEQYRAPQATTADLAAERPFKKVDVIGPQTPRYSRWHARVMQQREASGHGDLVRQLYEERLETLADQQGWE